MSTISATNRPLKQRHDALQRANDIRTRRSVLKASIKDGNTSVVQALLEPPDWALTMRVLDVLTAVPRVGQVKALKLLSRVYVAPTKTLGGLTDRQRCEIARLLQERAA